MKNAISPLTSTIIMIMFAVLLGAIVMSWGNDYAIDEERGCAKLSVDIIRFRSVPQACYKDGNVNFVIENNGKGPIDSFRVFVIGDDIFKDDIQLMLDTGDVARGSFDYSGVIEPKAVKFTPKIERRKASVLCASSSLTVDLAKCAEIEVE